MQVEVTQADIEAVREYCRQYPSNGGGNFDALVQAFARHRIAEWKAIVDWLRVEGFMIASSRVHCGEHPKGQAHD